MKSALPVVVCISTFLPAPLQAQTNPTDPDKTQSPIVVTASRTAETADESLASVTVITREEIANSSAREVADLLKMQAGIDISKNGGAGALTNIFSRGTNSNHTLVLIDGVRASSATTGTFSLERLTLNDIDHIEIVRGPRSTQWGSEAIGGIVHIFTRKNESQYARIGAGSFGTRQASAGIVAGNQHVFRLNGSYEQASGFSATNPNAGFFYNPQDNGYRKNNLNIGFTSKPSDSVEINVSGWSSNSQTEFDQGLFSPKGVTDTLNKNLSASFRQHVNSMWSHNLTAGYNYEFLDTTSDFPSEITSKRSQLDWQHDLALNDNYMVLIGFTRYIDQAKNVDTGAASTVFDESISNSALFTNLSYSGDKHDILLSIRGDEHSAFGSEITGLASWGIKFSPTLRATATISNAFRAPTINELYHPGFDFGLPPPLFYAGNPNLKPETSDGGELGMRWKISPQQDLKVTYFSNWIRNLIAFEGVNFQAINIARVRTRGFEIQHSLQEGKWTLATNITLQRAYDEETRTDLIRRPREKLSMTLGRSHSKTANSSVELLYSSQRLDGFNSDIILPSYTLVNLSTRFRIDKYLWADARVDNLTDEEYELASGFNTPRRSFFIGISFETE